MRRGIFVGGVALALAAVGGASTAQGEEPIVAEAGAWYTAESTSPFGNATIAAGDFPVGYGPHGEDKRSYLFLGVPEDATTGAITLRRSDTASTNYGNPGAILACIATEPFQPGPGRPMSQAPPVDCSADPATGNPVDGGYAFDISGILRRWEGGTPNHGIGFVAQPGQPAPWQVTFEVTADEEVGRATTAPSGAGSTPPPPPSAPGRSEPQTPATADFTSAPAEPARVPAFEPAPVPAPTGAEDFTPVPSSPLRPASSGGPLGPLPVNAAVWLLLPAGLAFFYTCARALGRDGDVRSPLDALISR